MSPRSQRVILILALSSLLAPFASAQGLLDTEPTPPDLIPGNASPARGTIPNSEIEDTQFCVAVTNLPSESGPTTHGAFDIILKVDGFEEGYVRVTKVLQAGESYEHCWSIRLATGEHCYHFIVDANNEVNETREDNNVSVQRCFWVRERPTADLSVEVVEVSPRNVSANAYAAFRVVVRNRGDATSEPTELQVVYHQGRVEHIQVKALLPGDSMQTGFQRVPAENPPGNFTVTATVDPEQKLIERSRANNVLVSTYRIADRPLPDLAITSASLEGELRPHERLYLNFTVSNLGEAVSPAALVRIYADGEPLVNLTVAELAAGKDAVLQYYARFPAGEHNLLIVADPDNAFVERNDVDNSRSMDVGIAGEVVDPTLPNLRVERLDAAPDDPRPGEVVQLVGFIHNVGGARSNATRAVFLIDGIIAGSVDVPALEAGRYATLTHNWPAQGEGAHTLALRLDPDNVVHENNESDNEFRRVFQMFTASPPPDRNQTTQPTPTTPTPTTTTPTTTTPTPTTPTPTTPTPRATQPPVIGEISVTTRPVPGGSKGVAVVSMRNPNLEPVGQMTVKFQVDGKTIVEKLVQGLGGAATAPVSSGEIDIPPGNHELSVEVRVVGGQFAPITRTTSYDATAGDKGIPAPGIALVLVGAAAVALARKRK